MKSNISSEKISDEIPQNIILLINTAQLDFALQNVIIRANQNIFFKNPKYIFYISIKIAEICRKKYFDLNAYFL